jgi:hypothetical protein
MKIVLFAMCVFSLSLVSGLRFAGAQPASPFNPKYSYLGSCPTRNYDAATGRLTAECYRENNGGTLTTSIPFLACDSNADIRNEDGTLYCTAAGGSWGQGHVLTAGSYQQTCTQMSVTTRVGPHHATSVILSGVCSSNVGGNAGGHSGASIDLIAKRCQGHDIWNDQSVLRCDAH